MNSKEQAKKGFKTFLLTLVISLVIFSGIYYVINMEDDSSQYGNVDKSEESIEVLGAESSVESSKEEVMEEESVFADLAGSKMEDQGTQVLAGSDSVDTTSTLATTDTTVVTTTTSTATTDTTAVATVAESTVPDTGVSGPTTGVVLTLIILGFAAYIMFLGPRNVALHNFEKDVRDDL